jgi:asparagine synthase (glutamine-hydrolysing)
MCEAIYHRGPDDQGIFIEKQIGLGMRRLSIIDVKGGHQPIQNESGDVTVIFNGEIYNYRTLRQDLLSHGHSFRTNTDTEVIVHAYEDDGLDCLKRFNGIFAIAIWDARRQRLFLARDRMGVKPLYYIKCGRGLAFASEIKALLTLPEVSRTLDLESAAQFFRLGFVPAPRTLFEGIRKLPPGFQVVIEENKIFHEPYWDFDFEGDGLRNSFADCSQQLQELLQEVVSDQMVSDVPIGAFLSGGIDSSAIVAFMKKAGTNDVRTYSIGFDEEHSYHNEAPHAEAVAKFFGTQHQTIIARPDIVDLMPSLIYKLDEPLTDTSFLVSFQVSELAHNDVKVILSGVGGDELFGGYRRYLSAGLHERISWVPQAWREKLGRVLTGTLHADRGTVWGNLSRYGKSLGKTLHLPFAEQYLSLISIMSSSEVQKLFKNISITDDPAQDIIQMFHKPSTSAALNRLLYVDSKTVLPESLLLLTDRMGMAASLEVRVPFLDNKIIDFVSKLPSDYRLKGFNLKRLLKAALKGVVPDSVLTRSKRGFGTPMGSWLKKDLRPMVKDLLNKKRLKRDDFFNSSLIEEMISRHESGQEDFTEPIFTLLTFHIWLDTFHVRLP